MHHATRLCVGLALICVISSYRLIIPPRLPLISSSVLSAASSKSAAAESEVVIVSSPSISSSSSNSSIFPPYLSLPRPYDRVLDMNLERQTLVFDVVLGRELGLQIIQGDKLPMVGEVVSGSKAEIAGIRKGDYIVSTSATAGDSLWSHSTVEGVKSALSTRFIISTTVTIRFERSISVVPKDILSQVHIPYLCTVRVKRPIGLHVVEGRGPGDIDKGENGKAVLVQYVKPDLGAYKSRRIEVGDQIVAMSASWGDRLWAVNSVESFVVGVKMRTDKQLTFKLRRMVPLEVYSGQLLVRLQRAERRVLYEANQAIDTPLPTSSATSSSTSSTSSDSSRNVAQIADKAMNIHTLELLWKYTRESDQGALLNSYNVNKIMSAALRLERPDLAIEIFESAFAFFYDPISNPAKSLLRSIDTEDSLTSEQGPWVYENTRSRSVNSGNNLAPRLIIPLAPNNYAATTAAKAYGRIGAANKALALLPWLESGGSAGILIAPDSFFMSALLWVCAKEKKVSDAERIFWQEMPKRNLTYTIAHTNSLMFMYAKCNRAEDALKVYDIAKGLGISCTVVTYGVLIKALMKSGKKKLEEASFEILNSLPGMGIEASVELYNQFFEHYSRTHNYRQTKAVLRMMASSSNKIKPDSVSYGYLINCFAEAKKPRSAIAAFRQMTKRRIPPNAYTYMGVLKALSHQRDGLSAVQVLSEMREKGVTPDKRHYAMAMFTCVTSGQHTIAESIFSSFLRGNNSPDTALYTLLLRALLQQKKWAEGSKLFNQMLEGTDETSRANIQTINCFMQYQINDEMWKEALETLQKALRYRDHPSASPSLSSSVFSTLSFAMGSYSSQVVRMHKEDALAMELANGGSNVAWDNGYYSSRLPPPSAEGLKFIVNCLNYVAEVKHALVPELFYTELLKALVLEGLTSSARRLLEMRSLSQIRIKTENDTRLRDVEALAIRALQKLGGSSAMDSAKALESMQEARELRKRDEEEYVPEQVAEDDDSLDDELE